MKEGLYFVPLGGVDEIGMSIALYGYNDQWIIVDIGIGFGTLPWQEVFLADPTFAIEKRKKIKGILITHSHEDHIGGVPYIWPMLKCPIYTTTFAANFLREKLHEFDLTEVPIIEVPQKKNIILGDFSIEFIRVTHSVPESSIISIKTPLGTIVHTGDWKIDKKPTVDHKIDEKSLKRIGDEGVLALVCDSTNVFEKHPIGTEEDVRDNLIQLVKQFKGKRVIVTCFASNLSRIESCVMAAKESGRKIAIIGHSLKRIEKIARASGYLTDIPEFYSDKKAQKLAPSEVLLICTGSQGEPRSALSQIASGKHPFIKLNSGDVVIFSSRDIPGNEKEVSVLQNKLAKQGIRSITSKQEQVHVSGHPSKEELLKLYSWIRPQIIIPIHGGARNLLEQSDIALEYGIPQSIVPHDGSAIKLAPSPAEITGVAHHGCLVVDGSQLVPLDSVIQKEKLSMAYNGIAFITIMQKRRNLEISNVSFQGLFTEKETNIEKTIINDIKNAFIKEVKSNLSKENVQKIASKIVRKIMDQERGKKPVVISHII